MRVLGKHIILELWESNVDLLNNEQIIKLALLESVEETNSTLVDIHTHRFLPQGVSGIAVLEESHISIHTWPEYRYAAVDIFTCGDSVYPERAIPVFKKYFKPKYYVVAVKLDRGVLV